MMRKSRRRDGEVRRKIVGRERCEEVMVKKNK